MLETITIIRLDQEKPVKLTRIAAQRNKRSWRNKAENTERERPTERQQSGSEPELVLIGRFSDLAPGSLFQGIRLQRGGYLALPLLGDRGSRGAMKVEH